MLPAVICLHKCEYFSAASLKILIIILKKSYVKWKLQPEGKSETPLKPNAMIKTLNRS